MDRIFTDLVQLFVECWGNSVTTDIFNILVELFQVVSDGGTTLYGFYYLVRLLPGILSAVTRQFRSVPETFDHWFLGTATTPRLEVMAMARDAGLVRLLVCPMSTERLPFLGVLLARNTARKQQLPPHPAGYPTTTSQPAQTIFLKFF